MKGLVKAYSPAVNAGIIDGHDGRCYQFHADQWLHKSVPCNDIPVVFDAAGTRAVKVSPEKHKGE